MNMLNARWKIIALAGVIVLVVAAISLYVMHKNGSSKPQNNGNGQDTTTITNASATLQNLTGGSANANISSTSEKKGSTSVTPSGATPVPAPLITIDLLTPVANNIWKIGTSNPIAWDNAANVTGEIDLVNAKTKSFIGVILSETGPRQTSYSWNTREISRARYSADKKDVVTGVYSIRIKFDGNGLGDLVSGPITITN
jgi:hypothetical protein